MPFSTPKEAGIMVAQFKLGIPPSTDDLIREELIQSGLKGTDYVSSLGVFRYTDAIWKSRLQELITELQRHAVVTRAILEATLEEGFEMDDPYFYAGFDFIGARGNLEEIGWEIEDELDEEDDTGSYVQVFRAKDDEGIIQIRHRVKAASLAEMYERSSQRLARIEVAHTGLLLQNADTSNTEH